MEFVTDFVILLTKTFDRIYFDFDKKTMKTSDLFLMDGAVE